MISENMKIVYIEPDEDIRDLYTMKLEADFSANILSFLNEKEAMGKIKLEKGKLDVNLVLIDAGIVSADFIKMYQFFVKTHFVPMLIIHDEESIKSLKGIENFKNDHICNRTLKKPIQADVFRKTITEALADQSSKANWMKHAEHGHNRVKINNFLKFNVLPCDAFIRIGDTKFVKLINGDDMYTTEVIKKYIEKNVEHLYVKQEDYPTLANTGIQTLISLYDRRGESGSNQGLQLSSIENIHNVIHEIGLTKDAAELTKKTIHSSVQLAKRVKSISDLLNKMKTSGNYIYDHSLKMSYICTAIAKHTEWGSDATVFKLSLACTMHDMTLEDDKIARIQSLSDPALKSMDPALIEIIKQHPQEAAKLIKDAKEFPPDVDFIVAQHHERPDGSGFPRGLSKLRIAPLSCVFILAHEFVTRIEEAGGAFNQKNRDSVYEALSKDMYTIGNFKKPFAGLRKAFNLAPKETDKEKGED